MTLVSTARLSRTMSLIEPSGTISLFARAREMAANGRDIISLAVGELDYHSPAEACTAGKQAIDNGFTRYTISSGTHELRQALANKLKAENDLSYSADEILVSNGSKQAAWNILKAICNPGDEVIFFAPYYPSYPSMVHLVGATPVVVGTSVDDGYQLDQSRLQEAITPRTRIIIANSPRNPTGTLFNHESWSAIAKTATDHDLWIISDEIYERIVFPPAQHLSPAQIIPDLLDRTVVVNGFSKNYAMTGWRVGYAAGPRHLIDAAALIQSHVTNNACSVSQKAALAALKLSEDFIGPVVNTLQSNRDSTIESLLQVEGLKLAIPQGAFFVFCDISQLLGRTGAGKKISTSAELSEYLLLEHGVACPAGSAFGDDGAIRISFAPDPETIKEGCRRIVAGLMQLT
ncbi:MAG: pyridoxal phosphate-dependent aminotransferase [Candidatus Zixiibacteriota bacterium]